MRACRSSAVIGFAPSVRDLRSSVDAAARAPAAPMAMRGAAAAPCRKARLDAMVILLWGGGSAAKDTANRDNRDLGTVRCTPDKTHGVDANVQALWTAGIRLARGADCT